MEAVFLKIVNMSITAGWLILAVILLRIVLKNAPKWIRGLLWALVGIRLVCPFAFESEVSLLKDTEPVSVELLSGESSENIGDSALSGSEGISVNQMSDSNAVTFENSIIANNINNENQVVSDNYAESDEARSNISEKVLSYASVVWLSGIVVMLMYCAISFMRIRKRVAISMKLHDNIYICDDIDTPFILGIIRPRIYLPSDISAEEMACVIAHEQAHLARHDNWWKPMAFAILAIYWFNPLIWLAYILLCRDIELACDERVIKNMRTDEKKKYSEVLLSCSTSGKMNAATPLAFGEVAVKSRIKSVLSYKKPTIWIMVVAIIAGVALMVGFMTNPVKNDTDDRNASKEVTEASNVNCEENIIRYYSLDDMYCIELNEADNTCYCYIPMASISGWSGEYEITDKELILTFNYEELGEFTRVFARSGDKLVYDISSSKCPDIVNISYDDNEVFVLSGSDSLQAEIDKVIGEGIAGHKERHVELASETELNESDEIYMGATITLYQLNKTFTYSSSPLSSYILFGTYEYTGDKLILYVSENEGGATHVFVQNGDKFVYSVELSSIDYESAYSSETSSPFLLNEVFVLHEAY